VQQGRGTRGSDACDHDTSASDLITIARAVAISNTGANDFRRYAE
jgi:hypothetical protein